MTCGLSIATRTGLHLRCALEDGHDGACMPTIDGVPRPRPLRPWPARVVEGAEPLFLSHLLNIVEAAVPCPTGAVFTASEAINLCRSLIWQRLGRQEIPF